MTEADRGERPLEYWLERVRALPKIAVDDERVAQGAYDHRQFGNNFYMLWMSLDLEVSDNPTLKKIYGDRARRLPGWDAFVEANPELLARMHEVLIGVYKPFAEVKSYAYEVINARDWDAYGALGAAAERF